MTVNFMSDANLQSRNKPPTFDQLQVIIVDSSFHQTSIKSYKRAQLINLGTNKDKTQDFQKFVI